MSKPHTTHWPGEHENRTACGIPIRNIEIADTRMSTTCRKCKKSIMKWRKRGL